MKNKMMIAINNETHYELKILATKLKLTLTETIQYLLEMNK